jgi:hypothetical protein
VLRIRETDRATLLEMGRRAQRVVAEHFSRERLCSRFCDVVERGAAADHDPAPRAAGGGERRS